MAPTTSLRVLVVDDEPDTAATFSIFLRRLGHDVREITDGTLALNAARDFAANVVFLDIGMPVVTGYELASILRKEHGERIWLCAITGYGSPHDRKQARQAGFDCHIVKPVDFELVKAILTQYMESGRSGPPLPR